MMKLRRGSSLVEVVVAIAILTIPLAILVNIIGGSSFFVDYCGDRIILDSLAKSKMDEILFDIQSNQYIYDNNSYYGFQYDPGTDYDILHNPALSQYSKEDGTFWALGHPECRYQFYVINKGNNFYEVHLEVWKRPSNPDMLPIAINLIGGVYAYNWPSFPY